jgi:hypothetical protein
MTFPCKEEFVMFEQLERRQKRIYAEACDYGVPLGDIKDVPALRSALNSMLGVFKKPRHHYNAVTWGDAILGGKSVEFFIPIEYDGDMESGYQFKVSFCIDRHVSGGGFISIDIDHISLPIAEHT